ncbi:AAA domain protein [Leptospira interrogans str. 2003000735]|uniref:AAA domain protein n=2 Tax=Leptospira interrogans TaxID=173 RepID=A0A829DAS2_LEPIR|nr:ATP-binding protein [Leptospira interrogans]EMY06280.1 AAA domain protein [Leptospira interrogans str. 2002000626]EMY25628.1 AAA domain protein [Leptospira interrogans serovar Australis str. 200703203]EKN89816.1 AAA domain protein [Leptospira interrogans str. 2002000624]EKQ40244.1 AAA domain protein [Leptospira interrogans str. 2002000621]EKQ46049.1 AAA domain protein [Leptospira interrogans str. 2002000623]
MKERIEELSEVFVRTKNSNRILNFCTSIADKNQWTAIIGQPGSGKTEIKKEFLRLLRGLPDKYIVVEIPVFQSAQPRTAAIMKELIKSIDPDIHVPGSIEFKYRVLRSVLVNAHESKKKVVMVFEESQNLSHNMMRELKMLHEIEGMGRSNLFSMIMFLKTSPKFEEVFKTREIGKRVLVENMQLPTSSEALEIAQKRFGLTFQDAAAKSDFLQATGEYPASIKHLAQTLWKQPGFNGKVSKSLLISTKITAFKEAMIEFGISNRVIKAYFKRVKNKEISLGAINESINFKRNGTMAEEIRAVAGEMLEEAKLTQAV